MLKVGLPALETLNHPVKVNLIIRIGRLKSATTPSGPTQILGAYPNAIGQNQKAQKIGSQ